MNVTIKIREPTKSKFPSEDPHILLAQVRDIRLYLIGELFPTSHDTPIAPLAVAQHQGFQINQSEAHGSPDTIAHSCQPFLNVA